MRGSHGAHAGLLSVARLEDFVPADHPLRVVAKTLLEPRGPGTAAAAALRSSQSALGAYYRRMCARMDKPKAVTAAAHKLARLIYAMLASGQEYTDRGQDYFEERYRQRVLHNLAQKAKTLVMQLIAVPQPA